MAADEILENTSNEPLRLNYAGKTYLFAGVDGIGKPVPVVLRTTQEKKRHLTPKGIEREVSVAVKGFHKLELDAAKKPKLLPGDVLVDNSTIRVSAAAANELFTLATGRLKRIPVNSKEAADIAERYRMELSETQLELARLEAEKQALIDEQKKLGAKHAAEMNLLREDLRAAKSKRTPAEKVEG